MNDLTTLTDDDLDALRIATITEIERRQRLATIPAQVAVLATAFVQGGGDQAALEAAIVVPQEAEVPMP